MRGFALLALALGLSPGLRADAASSVALAAQAEKVGDWQEALGDYQVAYAASDDDRLLRSIGNCQARLGRWSDASDSFERYLAKHPEDQALRAYEDKLKASLARRPASDAPAAAVPADTGVDGVTVFMKENPRDKKSFQVTLEMLTPLIAGLDFAYLHDRHNDFGLGFVGISANNGSGNLFHPRYRYHSGRFYWDSFFELGGLFGGYKQDDGGGGYTQASVTGGDLGIGVDYKNEGPWTFAFLLSFNFVGGSTHTHTVNTYNTGYWTYVWDPYYGYYNEVYVPGQDVTTTSDSTSGGFVAYPLIGMSFGFAF
jgi:hypothetical protein